MKDYGGRSTPSSSSSSCAACKSLKRKCNQNCQFAPYFRSDDPIKFAHVHKVFGASNVSKILSGVPEEHREEAVNSLVYEAAVRLQDPVYGCIGAIAALQRRMVELQNDLNLARARIASYRNFLFDYASWNDEDADDGAAAFLQQFPLHAAGDAADDRFLGDFADDAS